MVVVLFDNVVKRQELAVMIVFFVALVVVTTTRDQGKRNGQKKENLWKDHTAMLSWRFGESEPRRLERRFGINEAIETHKSVKGRCFGTTTIEGR
jgi:hypothetical protein